MVLGNPLAFVYRTLLKKARDLQHSGATLLLQPPFEQHHWGSYRFETPDVDRTPASLQILPFLAAPPSGDFLDTPTSFERITGDELSQFIKYCFRDPTMTERDPSMTATERDPLQKAFAGLRALLDQMYLMKCSSVTESDGVIVSAAASFDQMSFDPRDDQLKYQFSYRVRIKNLRDTSIQVLGREWIFENESGRVEQEVQLSPNNAIVGQQPVLPPDTTFEYYSGAFLSTPTGVARGRLLVFVPGQNGSDTQILAEIAPFNLLTPPGAELSDPDDE